MREEPQQGDPTDVSIGESRGKEGHPVAVKEACMPRFLKKPHKIEVMWRDFEMLKGLKNRHIVKAETKI